MRFHDKRTLFGAVVVECERRFERRFGVSWRQPGLGTDKTGKVVPDLSIDGSRGTVKYLRGEFNERAWRTEQRARRIHRSLRAALIELGSLAVDTEVGGYECAIRLRMFAEDCLPVVRAHFWVVLKKSWSPTYKADPRSALLQRLLEDGGADVLGLTKPPRPVDIAVISLLVGHRPELPGGWRATGLRTSEVVALERNLYRDRLKKQRRRAKKMGAKATK